jgi:hypothetical protein
VNDVVDKEDRAWSQSQRHNRGNPRLEKGCHVAQSRGEVTEGLGMVWYGVFWGTCLKEKSEQINVLGIRLLCGQARAPTDDSMRCGQ